MRRGQRSPTTLGGREHQGDEVRESGGAWGAEYCRKRPRASHVGNNQPRGAVDLCLRSSPTTPCFCIQPAVDNSAHALLKDSHFIHNARHFSCLCFQSLERLQTRIPAP